MKRTGEFRYWAFLLVGLCAVLGCSHSGSVSGGSRTGPLNPPDSIPAMVFEASLNFVASRVGEQFCRDNVHFDRARWQSSARPLPPDFVQLHPDLASSPYFRMCYLFGIPESPWVDGRIEFFVDGMGHLLPDTHVDGIPDCIHQPSECVFPIDKAEAFRLAKEAGLEEGLRPWEASFHWQRTSADSGTYVWSISNTRHVSAHREGGVTIVIDANSGEVLPHGHMGWESGWSN